MVEEWLETYGGSRAIGPEFQGLRPEIVFWRPKTWGDVFNAWRIVWRHLFAVSRSWSDDDRKIANSTLIDSGRKLLDQANVADEVMETLFTLSDDPATDTRTLTHMIIQKLMIEGGKMPKGIRPGLKRLDKKITGRSFWDRFSRYALNTSWDEDYSVRDNSVKRLDLPPQRVDDLVREVNGKQSLFAEHLPKLVVSDGHRLSEFAAKLAQVLHSEDVIHQVVAAQLSVLPEMKAEFISGYFSGLKQVLPDVWESWLLRLLKEERSRGVGISIVFSSGVTTRVLEELVGLFRIELVPANVFSRLWLTDKKDGISKSEIEEVVSCLLNSDAEGALAEAIELVDYYFFRKENPVDCEEQLLLRLLAADGFFSERTPPMMDYHWYCVANGFLERFPERELELFSTIVAHARCMMGPRSRNDPIGIADEVAERNPKDTWTIVSGALEKKDSSHYISSWLGDGFGFDEGPNAGAIRFFDPNLVMSWVLDKPETRARTIASCLPKTLNENEGGLLTRLFLEKFGNDDVLASYLISHFWTGGWTGSESAHFSKKRDKAREWISGTRHGNVLSWLYRYIQDLSEKIEQAELEEEREQRKGVCP